MALTKQAKTLTPNMEKTILVHLAQTRYPTRNKAMFLLSVKAGMRAKEIAGLTWAMITDAEGNLQDSINLVNQASKGKNGGRQIPMNRDLHATLRTLLEETAINPLPAQTVIRSERGDHMTAVTVTNWFFALYQKLGLDGCSSHSGRRTFATRSAKAIVASGGSLKDVQELMGHTSISMTQRYIEGSETAKRIVVNKI